VGLKNSISSRKYCSTAFSVLISSWRGIWD